jgi:hypothetical protein
MYLALLKSLATDEPSKRTKSQVKEQDNENKECKAGDQDCDSDGSDGRHLHRSDCSAGTGRGRRATYSVPSGFKGLPVYAAAGVVS